MSRKILTLVSVTWFTAFSSSLFAANNASDVVELPTVSVNEQASAATDRPIAVVTTDVPVAGDGLADLTRQVPGLAWNDAGAHGFGLTVSLRGLGNTPFFGDASAPVYLDDIPLANAFSFPSGLYDFSRVDVYRGPQANTRFGRAGDAGVIQLISSDPTSRPAGTLRVSLGNYGLESFSAAETSARTAQADESVSVGASRRDGYIRNTELNQDVDDRQSVFGRVRLRFRPASDWEFSLHLIAEEDRDGAQPLVPLGGSYDEVVRGKEGESITKFGAAALGISKRFADGLLTATSSFTSIDLSPYSNRLVVYGGFDFDSAVTQSQRAFNEEIKFVNGDLITGAFFSHSRTEGGAVRSFSGFTVENSSFETAADSFAAFGRRTFLLAPGWSVIPGLRYEYTKKDFVRTEVVPNSAVLRENNDWNALLPSLTLSRQFEANSELSLTLARGYKPGGYSAYTGVASLAGFDPQRTWGIEAAYTITGGHPDWSFTARAYAYRVRGYQIERSFAVPTTSSDEYLVVNADRARVLGVELESTWRPWTDVTIAISGALTQATLDSFTDPFTGDVYSGNRAPMAPSGNASLHAVYEPAKGFFGSAGVTWTGTTFYDEKETESLAQKSYALAEAATGYTFGRGQLRVFGRNLGDKRYYSSITAGVAHGTPGAPFTWGAEYDYHW